MPLYTVFDKIASKVIKEHQPATLSGDPPIGMEPHLAWLEESTAPEPVFDANTQRLQPSEAITIDPANTQTGTRVFSYSVVPLSEEQLADRAIQAVLQQEAPLVRAIVDKMKAEENVTQDEALSVVKYMALRDRLDL